MRLEEIRDLKRKQWLGIAGIVAALLGLLVVPPLIQEFYGVEFQKTLFVILVFYASMSWLMKRN